MNKHQGSFAIVVFDEHNETDVVPSSWLVDQGKFCWWPNYRTPSKIVASAKKMELPTEQNFTLYRSRVLKTYNSYDMAILHIKKAEKESELSSEGCTPPKPRRSKITSNKQIKLDIESSSENDSDPMPEPPKFPHFEEVLHDVFPSTINQNRLVNDQCDLSDSATNNAGAQLSHSEQSNMQHGSGNAFVNYQDQVASSSAAQCPPFTNPGSMLGNCRWPNSSPAVIPGYFTSQLRPGSSECYAGNFPFQPPRFNTSIPEVPHTFHNSYSGNLIDMRNQPFVTSNHFDYQSHPNTFVAGSTNDVPYDGRLPSEGFQDAVTTDKENDDVQKQKKGAEFESWLVRNVTIMKAQLRQLQESVDILLHNGDSGKLQNTRAVADVWKFEKLPIENTSQLELFADVVTDKAKRDLLVKHLSVYGGKNYGECTRRILSALLTDEAAEHISWLGSRGDKLSFSKSVLKSLVFDTVRQNSLTASATDSQMEQIIKEWLKNAKKRMQRLVNRNSGRASPGSDEGEDLESND